MEDGADIEAASGVDNGGAEAKKTKVKKPKKPKVTVAEASAKIDASDLAAFLADITAKMNPANFDIEEAYDSALVCPVREVDKH
ncbi:unnamed protein product [Camellia sinensis]